MQSYLQIILENLPAEDSVSVGIHNQQAARLQELVEFIQSQVCLLSISMYAHFFVHRARNLS
jgi:hypothetical protein